MRDFALAVEFTACDEVFALLGASGSGKFMTLKCIAGIKTPDAGKKINLPPQDLRAADGRQKHFRRKKISDDKIFAEDWQLSLSRKKIPDGLKAIGIRARDLENASETNA